LQTFILESINVPMYYYFWFNYGIYNTFIICHSLYNVKTYKDWEIVEEPKYEYLWVVEPKSFGYRVLTHKYYKAEEDVKKDYTKHMVFEKCEWSKREITNEN